MSNLSLNPQTEVDESDLEYSNNLEDFSEFDEFENYVEEKHAHLPLINKVSADSLAMGFGDFVDKLIQKIGIDNPVRVGETYSSLIIIPRALRITGRSIQPKDTFGLRLWELLTLLQTDFQLRDDSFRKRLVWEVNRAKGALLSFGRTSIAKQLAQSGRVAIFLVNRACDSIDPDEILVNPSDAENFFLSEGDLVLVGRYPGSSFVCCRVVYNDKVPESTAYTPTKTLLSHQGDVDGDTILLLKVKGV